MAIRTLEYCASLNGVTPATEQNAGVAGEHNATNVVIKLSAELLSAVCSDRIFYRFEFLDGFDQYDTTENSTFDTDSDFVSIDLPNGWTSSGGLAILRLVIAKLGLDNKEEMVLYSLPCRLFFESRSHGVGTTPQSVEKGLSGFIADANQITSDAQAATLSATSAAQSAMSAYNNASAAASNANAMALSADEQSKAAQQAAGIATNAAEMANTAATAADSAASYANSAANLAKEKAEKADIATDSAISATTRADAAAANAAAAMESINAVDGIVGGDGGGHYSPVTVIDSLREESAGVKLQRIIMDTAWWAHHDIILAAREIGYERTANGLRKKVGDGVKKWSELPYAIDAEVIDQANRIRGRYASRLCGMASHDTLISLTDSADASDFTSVKVLGKSTQDGIPATDAPLPVTGVTPTKVSVRGKNWIGYNNSLPYTNLGVKLTYSNGTYTLSGTSAGYPYKSIYTIPANTLRGTYRLSKTVASGTDTAYIRIIDRTVTPAVPYSESVYATPFTMNGIHNELQVEIACSAGITYNESFYIQLELGSTNTAYEAYTGTDYQLPALSALHRIGSIADSYDAVSGLETRNIGIETFDGTESFINPTLSPNTIRFQYPYAPVKYSPGTGLSTHFVFSIPSYLSDIEGFFIGGSPDIFFRIHKNRIGYVDGDTDLQMITKFKAWLAAQSTDGTPLKVYYQLAAPTTTQHAAQTIPQPHLNANIFTGIDAPVSIDYSRDIASWLQQKSDKVQETWITPTLINGWKIQTEVAPHVGYFKDSMGIVHMRGFVTGGAAGTIIFNLPEGYRPAQISRWAVYATAAFGSISIVSNGAVYFMSGANTRVSLNEISFRAEA